MAALTIKGVCLDSTGRVPLCRNDCAQWERPGGRPDEGEPFEACLVCEVAEETGLLAEVDARERQSGGLDHGWEVPADCPDYEIPAATDTSTASGRCAPMDSMSLL